VGKFSPKCSPDLNHHAIQIVSDRNSGNPNGTKALSRKDAVSDLVVLDPVFVRGTVDFNNQSSTVADKIENIPTEWRLPPEVKSIGPQSFQTNPQAGFGRRHCLPHSSRS